MRASARLALLTAAVALLGVGCPQAPPPPVPAATPPSAQETPVPASPTSAARERKDVDLRTVPGAHPAFAITLSVPASWEVEVVPDIEAINLYDPAAPGATPREQSQVFVRHFRASDFQTLSTVTIHARTPGTTAGRPSVTYVIEKNPGVPPFPSQPSWRNTRHRVTDVRLSDTSPSEFLVFGKHPELPDAVFDEILSSIRTEPQTTSSLVTPTRDFAGAVTQKPFGIFITPETSPVQPERFRGYHTGADAELAADTPVFAIAAGTVVRSGRVSGYGGMVAIDHEILGERLVGIYGHLDPSALPPRGVRVEAGEQIGVLGKGFSVETDEERTHLHFALYGGPGVNIAGYARTETELRAWRDPVAFLTQHGAGEP